MISLDSCPQNILQCSVWRPSSRKYWPEAMPQQCSINVSQACFCSKCCCRSNIKYILWRCLLICCDMFSCLILCQSRHSVWLLEMFWRSGHPIFVTSAQKGELEITSCTPVTFIMLLTLVEQLYTEQSSLAMFLQGGALLHFTMDNAS